MTNPYDTFLDILDCPVCRSNAGLVPQDDAGTDNRRVVVARLGIRSGTRWSYFFRPIEIQGSCVEP
jgi:hypothetical protein